MIKIEENEKSDPKVQKPSKTNGQITTTADSLSGLVIYQL